MAQLPDRCCICQKIGPEPGPEWVGETGWLSVPSGSQETVFGKGPSRRTVFCPEHRNQSTASAPRLPTYVRALTPHVLAADTDAFLLDKSGMEKQRHVFPSGTVVYVESTRYQFVYDSPSQGHDARIVTGLIEGDLAPGSFYRYRLTEPTWTEVRA